MLDFDLVTNNEHFADRGGRTTNGANGREGKYFHYAQGESAHPDLLHSTAYANSFQAARHASGSSSAEAARQSEDLMEDDQDLQQVEYASSMAWQNLAVDCVDKDNNEPTTFAGQNDVNARCNRSLTADEDSLTAINAVSGGSQRTSTLSGLAKKLWPRQSSRSPSPGRKANEQNNDTIDSAVDGSAWDLGDQGDDTAATREARARAETSPDDGVPGLCAILGSSHTNVADQYSKLRVWTASPDDEHYRAIPRGNVGWQDSNESGGQDSTPSNPNNLTGLALGESVLTQDMASGQGLHDSVSFDPSPFASPKAGDRLLSESEDSSYLTLDSASKKTSNYSHLPNKGSTSAAATVASASSHATHQADMVSGYSKLPAAPRPAPRIRKPAGQSAVMVPIPSTRSECLVDVNQPLSSSEYCKPCGKPNSQDMPQSSTRVLNQELANADGHTSMQQSANTYAGTADSMAKGAHQSDISAVDMVSGFDDEDLYMDGELTLGDGGTCRAVSRSSRECNK
eukprot:scpid76248/ scgid6616/ 